MKIWKRMTALTATLTLAFTVSACNLPFGKDAANTSSSSTSTQSSVTATTPEEQARAYVSSVTETVESVKSFTVTLFGESNVRSEYYNEGGTAIDATRTEDVKTGYDVTIVVSEASDGLAVQMTSVQQTGSVVTTNEAIVKGGYLYSREYLITSDMTEEEISVAKATLWTKTAMLGEIQVGTPAELLNELFAAEDIEDAKTVLLERLEDKLKTDGVVDGKMTWSENYTIALNSALLFLSSFEADDTLETSLDKIFALVAPGLTVDSVLTDLETYAGKTLNEAVALMNSRLTVEYGTDLETLFNAFLSNDFVAALLGEALALVGGTVELKDLTLDSLLRSYGETSVDELVFKLAEKAGITEGEWTPVEDEPTYLEALLNELRAYVGQTPEQLNVKLPDFSNMLVSNCTVTGGLNVDVDTCAFEGMYTGLDLKMTVIDEASSDGVTFVKTAKKTVDLSFTAQVFEFSDSAVVVNAPSQSQIKA